MAFGSWLSRLFGGGGKKQEPSQVPASSKRDQGYEPPTQAVEDAAGEFLLGNEKDLDELELVESLQEIGTDAGTWIRYSPGAGPSWPARMSTKSATSGKTRSWKSSS
jgi:hypothetical protein